MNMKKYRKRIIWSLIILAVIYGGYKYFSDNKPVTTYVTEDVAKGTLTQTVSATGRFDSNEQVDLSFKSTGRIEKINVQIGDKVVKGQQLAVMEKGALAEQLRQAEADIQAQKNTLSDMVDKKDTTTKDQRDTQRAIVQKVEAARDGVLRQIRETSIVSPIDGIVIQKNNEAGELIAANSLVLAVANPNDLVIESNIPEVDIIKVAVGQSAIVTFDALTEKDVFIAKVIEIDPASTVIQDVVFYRVKLKIDNADGRLKIGMSCNDDILTAEKNDVLMIPERAVKTEGEKQFVEVLKADGITIEKVYVETGLSGDNGMIEVKNNLKEGEKVVTLTKSV